jgi:SAM-dependent methyltransferase
VSGKSAFEHAPSPTARQVADELRSSLTVRRRLSAQDEGEDAARLRDLGNLEGFPPVAKPGPAAPFVKGLRRVLLVFVRPWLATQTIFNRELARRFQDVATTARDLERRAPRLEQAVDDLDERIRALERDRTGSGSRARVVEAPVGDVASVERLFVHSRLPRPPGRVLVEGPAGAAIAADLTAFGFDVTTGPVAGATFDVVISLSVPETDLRSDGVETQISTRDAWRALRPGGQLILTVAREPHAGLWPAPVKTLEASLTPLLVIETLVAARVEGASISVAALPAGDDLPPGSHEALVLIHARRPDAPDR